MATKTVTIDCPVNDDFLRDVIMDEVEDKLGDVAPDWDGDIDSVQPDWSGIVVNPITKMIHVPVDVEYGIEEPDFEDPEDVDHECAICGNSTVTNYLIRGATGGLFGVWLCGTHSPRED